MFIPVNFLIFFRFSQAVLDFLNKPLKRIKHTHTHTPTWRLWSLMYSQTFLTASVRAASGTPRNWLSAGETGKGFRMAGVGFTVLFAAEEGLGVAALAAAIRALQHLKTPRVEDIGPPLSLSLSLSLKFQWSLQKRAGDSEWGFRVSSGKDQRFFLFPWFCYCDDKRHEILRNEVSKILK